MNWLSVSLFLYAMGMLHTIAAMSDQKLTQSVWWTCVIFWPLLIPLHIIIKVTKYLRSKVLSLFKWASAWYKRMTSAVARRPRPKQP